MGRIVHPSFLDGKPPVSASATTAPGAAHTYDGKQPYAEARPLREDETPRLLEDYRHATTNAMSAGFDGVQLHAANGYLIDQFLRGGSNLRTDAYGGSVENRIRLLDEVTRTLVAVAGKERTGVRLSPNGASQGVDDSDPNTLFTAAAESVPGQSRSAAAHPRGPSPEPGRYQDLVAHRYSNRGSAGLRRASARLARAAPG